VAVGVVRGVELRVDVETLTGHVNSDIPLDEPERSGRGKTQAEITVRSVSGSVEIERALEQVA
jgi:hypothetical protein